MIFIGGVLLVFFLGFMAFMGVALVGAMLLAKWVLIGAAIAGGILGNMFFGTTEAVLLGAIFGVVVLLAVLGIIGKEKDPLK